MKRTALWLELAVVGSVVPWLFFFRYFRAEGFPGDFAGALFVNGAAGGFSADLLISSFVFWLFLFPEARRAGVARPWLYVTLNLGVGLSCALPAFLYARQRALDATTEARPVAA
ncbi:MAG: DUF2834 domain-containing protein [Vicinamibacteria bacterium]|nr:DUF2834 domain-containing protein [Vicinamibacteria bacterium]